MNDGLCQCGCGNPAPIATRTVATRGRFAGQPMRFIRGHNSIGMDRAKPYKKTRHLQEDRGFETPCWIWQLKIGKAGYGSVRVAGHDQLAHRWYYEQAHGPIEDGLQIDHLCRVRSCVNPKHLEAVTPLENSRRGRSTKLTPQQAQDIERIARDTDLPSSTIAPWFGVSRHTVDLIRTNGADGPRRPSVPRSELP